LTLLVSLTVDEALLPSLLFRLVASAGADAMAVRKHAVNRTAKNRFIGFLLKRCRSNNAARRRRCETGQRSVTNQEKSRNNKHLRNIPDKALAL
jgi:hypothetical protein